MSCCIEITFENDIAEPELEALRKKIRMVLRGEAVPEVEVAGQSFSRPPVIKLYGLGVEPSAPRPPLGVGI